MKYFKYFFSYRCGPCRMLSPIMDDVARHIPVQKVNLDTDSELAANYGVRNIPTVILLENGIEVQRFIGVNRKETYLNAAR